MNHVIQLMNGIALIVDNEQFKIAKSKFMNWFSFSRFLTIIDVRGHKITIRKKDILLFEETVNQKDLVI